MTEADKISAAILATKCVDSNTSPNTDTLLRVYYDLLSAMEQHDESFRAYAAKYQGAGTTRPQSDPYAVKKATEKV